MSHTDTLRRYPRRHSRVTTRAHAGSIPYLLMKLALGLGSRHGEAPDHNRCKLLEVRVHRLTRAAPAAESPAPNPGSRTYAPPPEARAGSPRALPTPPPRRTQNVIVPMRYEERLGAVHVPVHRSGVPAPGGTGARSMSEKSPPVCAATALNASTFPRAVVGRCPCPGWHDRCHAAYSG